MKRKLKYAGIRAKKMLFMMLDPFIRASQLR